MKFFKRFEHHSDYETYINTSTKILPNVSFCKDMNDVHFTRYVGPIKVLYTVTDDSEDTLLYNYWYSTNYPELSYLGADKFTSAIIDGIEYDISTLDQQEGKMNLSIGEHTGEFFLKYPYDLTDEIHENPKYLAFFDGCDAVTKIIVPNGVRKIGCEALRQMDNLEEVVLPETITEISYEAFPYNYKLTKINIPSRVTKIGMWAFYDAAFTSITLPDTLRVIDGGAFRYCVNLQSIIIPKNIEVLGGIVNSTFQNAFECCSNVETITVHPDNRFYDSRDNCNAIIETATNTLLTGCKNTIIPNSVTSIGMSAFQDNNIVSITIPETITFIGAMAFNACKNLTTINIPNNITSFPNNVFFNCTSLPVENHIRYADTAAIGTDETSSNSSTTYTIKSGTKFIMQNCFAYYGKITTVILPDSIIFIGGAAFNWCTALNSITIHATIPPTIETYVFANNASNRKIYVPVASLNTYKTAEGWSEYASAIYAIS